MKAEIEEMERLLKDGSRQEILDYLKTHSSESRDETELRIKLADRELSLRSQQNVETAKTKELLKNSQRNRANG
ncbi:MAG: hypothetical protein J6U33_03795 [Paludibacteraceae bacterium]|nr:hypothetical protein [Paludibacteraceae bacterium]